MDSIVSIQVTGQDCYTITLLTRVMTAEKLSQVAAFVASYGLSVGANKRLSGGTLPGGRPQAGEHACIQLSISGPSIDQAQFKQGYLPLADRLDMDIICQKDPIDYRSGGLAVFDMDSTLIQAEVIDELALEAGVGREVAAITEQAMQGGIGFQESFRHRLALLKGLDESALGRVASRLVLTKGAKRLIRILKALGYKTAIVSGGFTWFAEALKEQLSIDYVYANGLQIVNGKVTGVVQGDIIDGGKKAELLKGIAAREGIGLEQVIAVGDGANDLQMLAVAGLGVAFHAKPLVRNSAPHSLSVSTLGLDAILYLLGWHDQDLVGL